MILVFIQAVLVIAAGVGLFRLWRFAAPSDPWLRAIVAAGFLGRAVVGQALFWISWARLPIARSMQIGDGLWFFAADASLYLPWAFWGAKHGLWWMITADRQLPSVMFIQTLGVMAWLFGEIASVGLLLNLFCYLGTIAMLVHWPAGTSAARNAAKVVIVALSMTPGVVLWSLQPLKDTFFQFLAMAFIALCVWWQRAWSRSGSGVARAGIAALMTFVLYALAGIRWYFAFAVILAALLFLVLNAFRTASLMIIAFSTAIALTMIFCGTFLVSAGPYVPRPLRAALSPWRAMKPVGELPGALVDGVDTARERFQRSGGNTAIVTAGTPPPPAHTPAPAWKYVPGQPPQRIPKVPEPKRPAHAAQRRRRLLSGMAAAVLPRTIGEALGLFHIVGGRAMLWFTEFDTLFFDASLLLAIAALAMHFRAAVRNPLTWFVVLLTLLVGVPLVYSVTNYGTLFRLREMIYLGLLLIPLTIASPALVAVTIDEASAARDEPLDSFAAGAG